MAEYDLITVGGGLAGASLARTMARRGARVLVAERETRFKDRVRGEGMLPWGVREARTLDLRDLLVERCALQVYQWRYHFGAQELPARDFRTTTPEGDPCLDFYHPDMQEVVLAAAAEAGAEVLRGVSVIAVTPGLPATVALKQKGSTTRFRAPVVAGADGRNSRVGRWAGFRRKQDPERLVVGGALLDDLEAPCDSIHGFLRPGSGDGALYFPMSPGRARIYYIFRRDERRRPLSGKRDEPAFLHALLEVGIPRDWLSGATFAGPLAMFEGADSWIGHPYSNGVALIGDAAASSDPSWGHGLSLALLDVRLLSEALDSEKDSDEAGHSYASAHDRAYAAVHTVSNWMTDLLFEVGAEADRRRARALPRLAEDPTRRPDTLGLGPYVQHDNEARMRLFGEV